MLDLIREDARARVPGENQVSYGLYIGRNATADGVAYLAGYGDEPSSHWLEVMPRCRHETGATIRIGTGFDADTPGRQMDIEQVPETARHIRVSYSYYRGVPAPLTNGGLNEHGVAVRDIWSPSRPELVAMTPPDQTGPNYSDLARIVLERARTAREGVAIIADLIARFGYSDYGGNSHIIADPEEAWVVIEFGGGKKLWVAERLGPNAIRASRPGYVGEIPVHDKLQTDYLFPPHFVTFATEQGWYDLSSGAPFDVNAIYGDKKGRWAGVQWIEAELADRAARSEKIGIRDIIWALRTPRLTGDTAGYGQIVPLSSPDHDDLRVLWHCPVAAIAAPFTPVFMGVTRIPEEFRQHRYLTSGEASRFLDLRLVGAGARDTVSRIAQGVESTRSAGELGKRLLNLAFQHHELFLPELVAVWDAFEDALLIEEAAMALRAGVLYRAGEAELAAGLLTYFSATEMLRALDLVEAVIKGLEARTRVLFGFSAELTPRTPSQIW